MPHKFQVEFYVLGSWQSKLILLRFGSALRVRKIFWDILVSQRKVFMSSVTGLGLVWKDSMFLTEKTASWRGNIFSGNSEVQNVLWILIRVIALLRVPDILPKLISLSDQNCDMLDQLMSPRFEIVTTFLVDVLHRPNSLLKVKCTKTKVPMMNSHSMSSKFIPFLCPSL